MSEVISKAKEVRSPILKLFEFEVLEVLYTENLP